MRARTRSIAGRSELSTILVRASLGSTGLRLAAMLLSFLVGVLLARELGPSGYGVYALVISTIALLSIPTEFGLPSLVTREVASAYVREDWGRMRGLIRWANFVVGITSLLVLTAVSGYLLLQPDHAAFAGTLIWGSLLIPLVALGNLRGATMRGLQQVVRGQLPEMLVRPGFFVLLFAGTTWLAGASLDSSDAMALNVLAAAAAFGIGVLMLRRAIPDECRTAVSVTSPRAWARSAVPLSLTEGMRYLQIHMLVLALGLVSTEADVGFFRVATQAAILVAFPISVLNLVVAPIISRLHTQEDHGGLQKVACSSATVMFVGAVVIFVPIAVLGQQLLRWCFGAEFEASYVSLLILGLGQLASAFFGPNATLLNMTNRERAVTRGFAFSLAVTSVLGVALVPTLGIEGAALASAGGLLSWNVLLWRDARRELGIDTSVLAVASMLRERNR